MMHKPILYILFYFILFYFIISTEVLKIKCRNEFMKSLPLNQRAFPLSILFFPFFLTSIENLRTPSQRLNSILNIMHS